MKSAKLSCLTGLCLLAANVAHAVTATWLFDGESGSGPYLVDPSIGNLVKPSSQLSLTLPIGVGAVIAPGASVPGSGDYLHLDASSQAINNGTELNFTLTLNGPVEINSLSYAAIVFMQNQGPDQISWTYSVNYGAGDIGPSALVTDTFKNKGDWSGYNPDFNIVTIAPATVTISGVISGADTLANNNGSVGFDSFSFDVNPIVVPEPAAGTLLLFGLVFLVGSRVRHASRTSPK